MSDTSFYELSNFFLKNISPEEGLDYLTRFILKMIPADRFICMRSQRNTKSMNVVIDYAKMERLFSAPSAASTTEFPSESSIRKYLRPEEESFVIDNNDSAPSDNLVSQWKAIVPEILDYRSTLWLLLSSNDKDGSFLALMLFARQKGTFTNEHGKVLDSYKPLYNDLVLKYIETNSDPYLVITGDSRTNLSSFALLEQCPALKSILDRVKAVAPQNVPVLVQGPSGAGKELVAEAIHRLSSCNRGPMVKVNCGAIPESLIDSEFFGHEKGAFTGANAIHQGYFEQANGGTLFLDEVGELNKESQVRLLRVLESGEITRIGGQRRISVNVRVVAATNKDLWQMVVDGTFREDLWYRLNTFPIEVPALSDRLADIPVLTKYFYGKYVQENKLSNPPRINRNFLQELLLREWPGNVRQLAHSIARAFLYCEATRNRVLCLDPDDKVRQLTESKESVDERYRKQIEEAILKCNGKLQGPGSVAEALGLNPGTLRSRMRKLGIPFPKSVSRGIKKDQAS